jgi:hypothetical protein
MAEAAQTLTAIAERLHGITSNRPVETDDDSLNASIAARLSQISNS